MLRNGKPLWRNAVVLAAVAAGFLFASIEAQAVAKKRGWLGVSIQELTPSLREALELGDRTGLLISSIEEDSPAEEAGLREEDVILEFNGKKVEKAKDLVDLVRNTEPGTKVKLKIFRDGKESTVEVKIGRRPRQPRTFAIHMPGKSMRIFGGRASLGVQVEDLNPDLGEYFGVKDGRGVLILEVLEDSPAEDAGLKAGDVILRLDDEPIEEVEDLTEALEDYDPGDEVTLEILRHGKREKIAVELEEAAIWMRGMRFSMPRIEWFEDGPGEERVIILRRGEDRLSERLRRQLRKQKEQIERIKRMGKVLHNRTIL